MAELDKKRIIEKCNRYNKINLTARWDSTTLGKLSFTLPPLTSSGFANPSKNDCLIKIRKVYIDLDDGRNDQIYWGVVNAPTTTPISATNGYNVMTSIMSRNNYFLTGSGKDVSGMSSTNSDFSASFLGVMVKGDNKYHNDNDARNEKLVAGGISYFDNSNIMDSGTLCSNPFGSKIDVWVQSEIGSDVLVPYEEKANIPPLKRYDNVSIRIELEVYVL
tara:strand:+ start:8631 stop:9287 length:657 start_codon:yes stop_codon:yes gene_type:complete